MSRKHFVALAETLREHRPSEGVDALIRWERLCRDIALVCKRDNPRFQTERFLTACGVS